MAHKKNVRDLQFIDECVSEVGCLDSLILTLLTWETITEKKTCTLLVNNWKLIFLMSNMEPNSL